MRDQLPALPYSTVLNNHQVSVYPTSAWQGYEVFVSGKKIGLAVNVERGMAMAQTYMERPCQ